MTNTSKNYSLMAKNDITPNLRKYFLTIKFYENRLRLWTIQKGDI